VKIATAPVFHRVLAQF